MPCKLLCRNLFFKLSYLWNKLFLYSLSVRVVLIVSIAKFRLSESWALGMPMADFLHLVSEGRKIHTVGTISRLGLCMSCINGEQELSRNAHSWSLLSVVVNVTGPVLWAPHRPDFARDGLSLWTLSRNTSFLPMSFLSRCFTQHQQKKVWHPPQRILFYLAP